MSKQAPKAIMYRGAKYVLRRADRESRKRLLSEALSAITTAQDRASEVLETGEYAKQMEEALDHLYAAYKLVSDSIPRG